MEGTWRQYLLSLLLMLCRQNFTMSATTATTTTTCDNDLTKFRLLLMRMDDIFIILSYSRHIWVDMVLICRQSHWLTVFLGVLRDNIFKRNLDFLFGAKEENKKRVVFFSLVHFVHLMLNEQGKNSTSAKGKNMAGENKKETLTY